MLQVIKDHKTGILAFIIVLLLMPSGHALMVLIERSIDGGKFIGAACIGILGVALLATGVRRRSNDLLATILGLLAGVLIWTGWVEFSFVWIAEKLGVPPLVEHGQVTTRAEYLVMLSSAGLLGTIMLLFLFSQTRCQFYNWFQKRFGYKQYVRPDDTSRPSRPLALITFIETVMVIWTFYIVLLLAYDKDIAGDRHPITYLIAFGSLFWSIYLFLRLIKVGVFDYAIRYAIPTVVIFWTFVEITGRWDLFQEIWVHPFEHWIENSIILALLIFFIAYYVRENMLERRERARPTRAVTV